MFRFGSAQKADPQPAVTRQHVEMCYRVFLHREPESEDTIRGFQGKDSLEAVLQQFLKSDEFRARFGQGQTPQDWPPIAVETTVDDGQLTALIQHVEKTWLGLGQVDPHWSVISRPEYHADTFATHAEEFSQSGMIDVHRFQAFLARAGLDVAAYETCFELGAGVGRLTAWLAKIFPRVIAADISRAHLDILTRDVVDSNVTPKLVPDIESLRALEPIDVFFSLIVLQHNPPPVMALLLRTCLSKLRSGGVGYFQLPTYHFGYRFQADEYLANLPGEGQMEMHVLPQAELLQLVQDCGCAVLEMREDGYTADINGISNTLLVRKR